MFLQYISLCTIIIQSNLRSFNDFYQQESIFNIVVVFDILNLISLLY